MLSWEPGNRGSQPLFFKSILVSACLLCYTEYSDSTQFDTIRLSPYFMRGRRAFSRRVKALRNV